MNHLLLILAFFMAHNAAFTQENTKTKKIALVIHGGAGTIDKQTLQGDLEKEYIKTLENALLKGYEILKNNGNSIDAVEASVNVLENSPLFNAGKGSVFNNEGKIEMDAAIMSGSGKAGAVACVEGIKNPVSAARAVMEKSNHVLLSGKGAEIFAKEQNLVFEDSSYFATDFRWQQLLRAKELKRIELDHQDKSDTTGNIQQIEQKYGTVGAVALDYNGNLAAATSTGGLTNKKYGRIGDTPLIGCGTWADNICAISCTGQGEFFIRAVAAYNAAARFKYKGGSLQTAICETIDEDIKSKGGKGGMIGISKDGETVMLFNTKGMYRGAIDENGKIEIKIFK